MSWWRPKTKKLNVQEEEKKRLAVLLTELETAAAQVLTEMKIGQIDETLERIRKRFQELKTAKLPGTQKERLGRVAQHFGLAAAQVLTEHGFDNQQIDTFLKRLVQAGERNRASHEI